VLKVILAGEALPSLPLGLQRMAQALGDSIRWAWGVLPVCSHWSGRV